MIFQNALITTMLSVAVISSVSHAQILRCEYALSPSLQVSLDKKVGKLSDIKGPIFGDYLEKSINPEGMIQFGFESEYTTDSLSKILNFYGPTEYRLNNAPTWQQIPIETRVEQVKNDVRSRAHLRQESGLVLLKREQNYFLPESLFLDDNTNLEVILKPVKTISDWYSEMKFINTNFGYGSMQTMVSTTKRSFYSNGIDGKLGYFTFTADMDALLKLQAGFKRYQENPNKDVARSFLHSSLGPFSKLRQDKLKQYLRDGYLDYQEQRPSDSARLSKDALRDVAMKEDSFKYAGTTTFRPDIGGYARVSVEVRDAHVSESDLSIRVQRAIAFMRGADRGFVEFASVNSFDSVNLFKKFSPELQNFLKTVAPGKLESPDPLSESEITALEVFRNFSYPLRDWKPYLKLMQHEFLLKSVTTAQTNYLKSLTEIQHKFESALIDKPTALRALQGALATFANDSGLPTAFETFYQSRVSATTEELN